MFNWPKRETFNVDLGGVELRLSYFSIAAVNAREQRSKAYIRSTAYFALRTSCPNSLPNVLGLLCVLFRLLRFPLFSISTVDYGDAPEWVEKGYIYASIDQIE